MKNHIRRSSAIVYRHLMYLRKPFEMFHYWYWILIDILIFGFLGKSVGRSLASCAGGDLSTAHIIFVNMVLLYAFLRGAVNMGMAFLRELWEYNFVTIFSTQLQVLDWLIALGTLCICTGCLSFSIAAFLVRVIFGFSIFSFGWIVFLQLLLLLSAGFCMGLIINSILLILGKQATPLTWALGWLFVPISGVYYSIDVIPPFLQRVAVYNPLYHIFSITRATVAHAPAEVWHQAGIAALLLLIYGSACLLLFTYAFNKSKKAGLTRLEVES